MMEQTLTYNDIVNDGHVRYFDQPMRLVFFKKDGTKIIEKITDEYKEFDVKDYETAHLYVSGYLPYVKFEDNSKLETGMKPYRFKKVIDLTGLNKFKVIFSCADRIHFCKCLKDSFCYSDGDSLTSLSDTEMETEEEVTDCDVYSDVTDFDY